MLHLSQKIIVVVVASMLSIVMCAWLLSDRLGAQEDMMGDGKTLIDEATARKIATEDAMRVYRDLSIYRVNAELKNENWYVDYDLVGEAMAGGGPHYIISGTTGEIIERRYEQ